MRSLIKTGPRDPLVWLLVIWIAGVALAGAADPWQAEGEPIIQYFSPREYHGGTQCLCATQDRNGVLYVGSIGLVLSYDGSAWRKIDVDSNYVSGIDYDAGTDTVFVGAENNLGYLKRLPGGGEVFVSLLDRLSPDDRDVGPVYGVHVTADGVYFVGNKQVMRWRGDRFQTWKLASGTRLRSDWVGGKLYVYSADVGLLRLDNDVFVSATSDPLIFRRAAPRSVQMNADGTLLVGTLQDGLFVLRDGLVRPAGSECGAFLKERGVTRMLRLRDGSLAVATNTAGLLILDAAGRFRSRADQTGGIRGTNLTGLFEDAEGGLWIGLQSGIARAEINSPFTILRGGPDDEMSSADMAQHWLDTIVLGTNSGLYRLVRADPAAAVNPHLERMIGTRASNLCNCSVENGLLTVSEGEISLLDFDSRLSPVASGIEGARSLCRSHLHAERVYAIDEDGRISALRLDAPTRKWVNDGPVADLGEKGGQFDLAESPLGDLWVCSKFSGLFRVRLTPGRPAVVTRFLGRPGPFQQERNVLLCSGMGPVRFRGTHVLCGLDFSGQEPTASTEFGQRFCDGSFYFGDVMSYDEDTVCLSATDVRDPTGDSLRGRAVAGREGRAPTFRALPHKIEEAIGKPGTFHPMEKPPEPLQTLLLVGTTGNGLVRVDVARWDAQPTPRPFVTIIRRAVTLRGADAGTHPRPILGEPLPYAQNSMHLEFAAGTLGYGAAPRFQTRLVGFGAAEWSDFSDRTSVDYLNLPEGGYGFEVRARNSDGQFGTVASLTFRVLPPWQRTPSAYALYALTLVGTLVVLIRWRGRRLLHRNAALANLVDARTVELRGRETELVRARDEAETANRAKSAFLANMSHELRTPLNAVLGYAQLLLKQTDLSPRSRERVAVIGQSGGHLLTLVNEVLDLAKVEAGKLTLTYFNCSLLQLLGEVIAAIRPRLAEKGLTFTENLAAGLPANVHTDPIRLRQVLFNLLGNAVKFTHHGGVTLTVRPIDGGRVWFEVSDTGVGVEPKEQRDIFLAFYQARESGLASQGTGLGLAISQRLVELLGGRIGVESKPGAGSRFWFELPLAAVEPVEGSPARISQDSPLGKVTGYEGATRRLLIVDDLSENRRVLRDLLQPLGFEIEEAADGKTCLAACARQTPDAVLLDLRLGTPDGFEVARMLCTRRDGPRPGIIAISASVFESDRQQAIDAGCDDFLPKPFDEAQLLAMLGRVIRLRWIDQTTAAPESPPVGAAADARATLSAREIEELRELSLSGDVAGIRRCLEAHRAAGVSGHTGEIVRRLESLVAAYDMEGIHDLLITLHPHDGD